MAHIERIAADAPLPAIAGAATVAPARGRRLHVAVFLAPALLVYTALVSGQLADTLRLAL